MDNGKVLLVTIGVILLVVLILLAGSGGKMVGMGMMAGRAANPVGAIVLFILIALIGLSGYAVFFSLSDFILFISIEDSLGYSIITFRKEVTI